ncbi:hypothetical protein D3C72_1680980 [compost metagenome]
MLEVQVEAGARGLHRCQRVDHDQAGIALDDRHVGDIEATDLVDPIRHLEQPVVHVQLRLAPQAGVHGGRRPVLLEEAIGGQRPNHIALGIADLGVIQRADKATARGLEVTPVLERQLLQHGRIGTGGGIGGGIARGGRGRCGAGGAGKADGGCSQRGGGCGNGSRVRHPGLLEILGRMSVSGLQHFRNCAEHSVQYWSLLADPAAVK